MVRWGRYKAITISSIPPTLIQKDITEGTFDLEYRWRFAPINRHTLMVGAGYRWVYSDIALHGNNQVREPVRYDQLVNAFIQDDIELAENQFYLTLGTKLEHNDYTGVEIQPSARLRWYPDDRRTLWAAVSRAVRTPSRAEYDMTLHQFAGNADVPGAGTIPSLVRLIGNHAMVSEELLAYEAGYRWQASSRLAVDATIFLNNYDHLRTFELIGSPTLILSPSPALIQQATVANKMQGHTHGLEMAVDFQPYEWWRLQGAYSFIEMDLKRDADSSDRLSTQTEAQSPGHQWTLRSSMDLRQDAEFDLWLRYVDAIPMLAIDSYVNLDARLGWDLNKQVRLSLVARNLLDSPRVEYKEFSGITAQSRIAEIEREIYLMAEWHF